jgi:hypothetical protein
MPNPVSCQKARLPQGSPPNLSDRGQARLKPQTRPRCSAGVEKAVKIPIRSKYPKNKFHCPEKGSFASFRGKKEPPIRPQTEIQGSSSGGIN